MEKNDCNKNGKTYIIKLFYDMNVYKTQKRVPLEFEFSDILILKDWPEKISIGECLYLSKEFFESCRWVTPPNRRHKYEIYNWEVVSIFHAPGNNFLEEKNIVLVAVVPIKNSDDLEI